MDDGASLPNEPLVLVRDEPGGNQSRERAHLGNYFVSGDVGQQGSKRHCRDCIKSEAWQCIKSTAL